MLCAYKIHEIIKYAFSTLYSRLETRQKKNKCRPVSKPLLAFYRDCFDFDACALPLANKEAPAVQN